MTTGIYSLYWEEQDLIYIGLSQNAENRFKDHIYDMKKQNHSNYKVQDAFNNYGEPNLIIIEECSIEELNIKEIQWMYEFDALGAQGLCIVEGGQVGFGTNSNASKYSKRTILKAFSLLYRTTLSQNKIASKLNINIYLIYDIARKNSHLWLKEVYPDKYKLMLKNNLSRLGNSHSAKEKDIIYPLIKSPEGEIFKVENTRAFATLNNLDHAHLGKVLNGKRKTHKGWKLAI